MIPRSYRIRDNAACPRCGREGWISYMYWGDYAYEDRVHFSHLRFHDETSTTCVLTGDELASLAHASKLSDLQS